MEEEKEISYLADGKQVEICYPPVNKRQGDIIIYNCPQDNP